MINKFSFVTIHPSELSGIIKPPSSKSFTQRACAAALLTNGKSILNNVGNSDDEINAIEIIKQLGAEVIKKENSLIIKSEFANNIKKNTTINCGESGLAFRIFSSIIALLNIETTITGYGSLIHRPQLVIEQILSQLQVEIKTNNHKLPFKIKGVLQPKNIEIDGSLSSQFLTGLLFAYSYKNIDATIKVNNLVSKPYIDLTLQVLKKFNLNVPENIDYTEFIFHKESNKSTIQSINYSIENDWSNAAFLFVGGAISGNISVVDLNINSLQSDKNILQILETCGCKIVVAESLITINKSNLNSFEFDATNSPDLFPPLVALASNCNGTSIIKGISRLEHKESNRAKTLQSEFIKMGVEIILQEDDMIINRTKNLIGARINSNNDHRIAMACTIAALNAKGETVIENAEAVNKSYPNFYKDLIQLGASIKYHS